MGAQGRLAFLRQVGRAVRGPGGPEGRASGAQPPAPESTFDASPAPHDKMATWAEGEPGPRGWGKERGGEKRQKQKGGPRNAEAGPRARGGGRAGRGAGAERGRRKGQAYFFLSFAPPAPSMANRSPRRLLGRRPPGSLRPKRWLPPHAGREGKAGPEVQGGKPLVRPEAGGAGSNRRAPGWAQKSLPSGCWSGPGPTHGPKRRRRRRRRSSRPLRRGGSGL